MSKEETMIFIRNLLILFENADIKQKDIKIKEISIYIEAIERTFRFIQQGKRRSKIFKKSNTNR